MLELAGVSQSALQCPVPPHGRVWGCEVGLNRCLIEKDLGQVSSIAMLLET